MIQELDHTKIGLEASILQNGLRNRVVGQEEAIELIASVYQMFLYGMQSYGRPIGNFLFLGPTGTGKTRTVEALAEELLGDSRAVIKINCGEFQHSHEIAKLVGSPPGYLGHRETHAILSQEALNRYHTETIKLSIVLFDEIEKASDALWNLLLGILDKAILTLGDNRTVDFSRAIIFMTSNLGAAEMDKLMRPNLGFITVVPISNARTDDKLAGKINISGMTAARKKFTPEFINRLDNMVVFKPLGKTELAQILDLELEKLQSQIVKRAVSKDSLFSFHLTSNAKEFLLREGTDMRYGARNLKRIIDRHIVHALSNLMATGQIRSGDSVKVDYEEKRGCLIFSHELGIVGRAKKAVSGK